MLGGVDGGVLRCSGRGAAAGSGRRVASGAWTSDDDPGPRRRNVPGPRCYRVERARRVLERGDRDPVAGRCPPARGRAPRRADRLRLRARAPSSARSSTPPASARTTSATSRTWPASRSWRRPRSPSRRPDGELLGVNQCAPLERIVRIQATGGTTGQPMRIGLTRRDIADYGEMGAAALWAMGCARATSSSSA